MSILISIYPGTQRKLPNYLDADIGAIVGHVIVSNRCGKLRNRSSERGCAISNNDRFARPFWKCKLLVACMKGKWRVPEVIKQQGA